MDTSNAGLWDYPCPLMSACSSLAYMHIATTKVCRNMMTQPRLSRAKSKGGGRVMAEVNGESEENKRHQGLVRDRIINFKVKREDGRLQGNDYSVAVHTPRLSPQNNGDNEGRVSIKVMLVVTFLSQTRSAVNVAEPECFIPVAEAPLIQVRSRQKSMVQNG